jgi:hypothetical protein
VRHLSASWIRTSRLFFSQTAHQLPVDPVLTPIGIGSQPRLSLGQLVEEGIGLLYLSNDIVRGYQVVGTDQPIQVGPIVVPAG